MYTENYEQTGIVFYGDTSSTRPYHLSAISAISS